jgi:DNA polymerase-3 subunit beta
VNTSENNGLITVPAKKMVDIIRSLEDNATPTISFNAGIITIKEGRSHFKLATLPAEDYPISQDELNDVEFSVKRTALIHLLQSTYFAMSQQDVRVFLNGLLLELDAHSITVVATDGHRMAINRLTTLLNVEHQRLLIPRKGVQEIIRLLTNIDDETIAISAGKSHFKLVTSQYTFVTKLIEARFPSYIKAIPTHQDKQVIVDRDLLKRGLSRIIILAHEQSRAVLLHIQPGALTLIANNQEQEEAIETLSADTQGDDLKIGINANYLLDVLGHLPEGLLRLSFANTNSSILVESTENELYMYIIMPMKI